MNYPRSQFSKHLNYFLAIVKFVPLLPFMANFGQPKLVRPDQLNQPNWSGWGTKFGREGPLLADHNWSGRTSFSPDQF